MTRFIRVACALAALVAAPAYAQEDAVTEEEPGDAEAAPAAVLVMVPLLDDDVHDLAGLQRIADLLTA